MSHKKALSQGNVPFSWEDTPGVSKLKIHKDYHKDIGLKALNLPPLMLPSHHDNSPLNIPLPPCQKLVQPPRRSTSRKGFWQEEDPFLAALKECTKSVKTCRAPNESSKNNLGFKVSKSKFIFSCKSSFDVKDESLVKLPPIPRERLYWRSFKAKGVKG